MRSAITAHFLSRDRPFADHSPTGSHPSNSSGTSTRRARSGSWHLASAAAVAFALVLAACARDAPGPVTAPSGLGSPRAAQVSDVITTTIIPVVPLVPPPDPNAASGHAEAINEAGVVAGWKVSPTEIYAFTWKDGVMTSLGTAYPLRNENLQAFFRPVAINRSGDVAGNNVWGQAVVWKDATLTTLATTGGPNRYAYDMNDKGQIVGSGSLPGQGTQAFLWENGTFTELGTLGGSWSVATAINKHGQVVGYSRLAGDAVTHAFLWERGVMTDLGTMEGGSSQAFGINDRGEVVGLTSRKYSAAMPFLWRKGVMSWMLSEPMSDVALYFITDISNAGHVVGYRSVGSGDSRAFVWRDGVDVNVGGGMTYAMSVNSSGEIAGYQNASLGIPGAYLWTVGRQGP
jgi:probable HAF family extracellular repeat protein